MTTTGKRIAVVTGSNKGIGLEICRQLASNGVIVILTARDEKRGKEAVEKLKESDSLSDIIFHQLDVTDSSTIASLATFVKENFGKLDILVNNAAIGGLEGDKEKILSSMPIENTQNPITAFGWLIRTAEQTYEAAEECLKTNFSGTIDVTEALLPFLESSNSGRIVNVTSSVAKGNLTERLKHIIHEADSLTVESLKDMSRLFLDDFKQGLLEAHDWPTILSAYTVSKLLINAYTRVMAKKHPALCINCVHPGFVKTDINGNLGPLSVEEGAKGPVMLALSPDDTLSGFYFDKTEVSGF